MAQTAAFGLQAILPWLQAGSAIVAVLVTWWLTRLTARYVKTTKKIAESSHRQVQHALDTVAVSQRGIAAALLEEVHRIRSELGPAPQNNVRPIVSRGSVVPSLLSWMQPVIPTAAQIDTAVVAGFMKLDRLLANLLVASNSLCQAQDALTVATDEYSAADHAQQNRHVHPTLALTALELPEAKQRLEVAEANATGALAHAEKCYAMCHQELDALEARLQRHLG